MNHSIRRQSQEYLLQWLSSDPSPNQLPPRRWFFTRAGARSQLYYQSNSQDTISQTNPRDRTTRATSINNAFFVVSIISNCAEKIESCISYPFFRSSSTTEMIWCYTYVQMLGYEWHNSRAKMYQFITKRNKIPSSRGCILVLKGSRANIWRAEEKSRWVPVEERTLRRLRFRSNMGIWLRRILLSSRGKTIEPKDQRLP
jgi:hypothetical protein